MEVRKDQSPESQLCCLHTYVRKKWHGGYEEYTVYVVYEEYLGRMTEVTEFFEVFVVSDPH